MMTIAALLIELVHLNVPVLNPLFVVSLRGLANVLELAIKDHKTND
jgi:hypothetical protein